MTNLSSNANYDNVKTEVDEEVAGWYKEWQIAFEQNDFAVWCS